MPKPNRHFICPECQGQCITRTSTQITPQYKELYLNCNQCDSTFVMGVEYQVVRKVIPRIQKVLDAPIPISQAVCI